MAPEDAALLEELLQHERQLQFSRFLHADALALGLALIDEVKQRGKAVLVDIRLAGRPLFVHAMDGTTADNAEWVRRKNNVVQRFGHSSFYIGNLYRARGTAFEAHTGLDPQEYAAHGGAFPLILNGVGPVGTITVSGLPQAEDHAVVVGVVGRFVSRG